METKPQNQKHDGKFEEQRGDDLAEVSTAGEVDQVEVGAQEREKGQQVETQVHVLHGAFAQKQGEVLLSVRIG